ncbi:helix-turn-helix transcriptional regulator [bacterium]|nr:helix-turn-helix transcriptional regulator [bacterium]
MDIKKKIGKRIKEVRKSRGLSQEKLSEMVDIAQNSLSYIENGDNFFTAETLEKLIIALKIEPQELFNFGHLKNNNELLSEINTLLNKNPERIPEFYKILKAIIN